MSIELIQDGHRDEIRSLFYQAELAIHIISPFIGRKTSEELAQLIHEKKLTCKVITRFYREDFIQGASSLEGLRSLINAGATIYSLNGLHTKLYIFDSLAAIITSANFTQGGLITNFELGIKAIEEDDLIGQCMSYFSELWGKISEFNRFNANKGLITLRQVDSELEIVRVAVNNRKPGMINKNMQRAGAVLKVSRSRDSIEDVFDSQETHSDFRLLEAGWIKFEADANHRHDSKKGFFADRSQFIRDKTFFPRNRRPRGIKAGQKIYLALISYDKTGYEVPMIMGRAYSDGFSDDFEANSEMDGWEYWMADYPYYIYLHDGEFLDGPAENGISMNDLYRSVGPKTYPSTYGRECMKIEDIRHYHFRKDKVRITPEAEKFLDAELARRFARHGLVKI
jgi:hypothetical protein